MEGNAFQLADLEGLAVLEQLVELRSVAFEVGARIEELAEYLLHANDAASYSKLTAEPFLQIRSC